MFVKILGETFDKRRDIHHSLLLPLIRKMNFNGAILRLIKIGNSIPSGHMTLLQHRKIVTFFQTKF